MPIPPNPSRHRPARPVPARSEPRLIAFYGSLRKDQAAFRRLRLAGALRHIGPCRIEGRLMDLGRYPGLVPGGGETAGDLFDIRDASALKRLDAYEGFDPDNRRGSLFVRNAVKLIEPDTDAWIYVYNRPVRGAVEIPGGDWVAYRRAKSGGR